jgi:hypothetical protein
MIPGWTSEKLDRLVKLVRNHFTPAKDKGFFENLYCLNRGENQVFTDLQLIDAGFDMTKNARKAISQHLGYYGRKNNKKYSIRKFHGGVKVWRIE